MKEQNRWGKTFYKQSIRFEGGLYSTIKSMSVRNRCSYTEMVNRLLSQRVEVDMINEGEGIKVEPEFYLTKDGVVKSLTV